jgi:hypothetical protein
VSDGSNPCGERKSEVVSFSSQVFDITAPDPMTIAWSVRPIENDKRYEDFSDFRDYPAPRPVNTRDDLTKFAADLWSLTPRFPGLASQLETPLNTTEMLASAVWPLTRSYLLPHEDVEHSSNWQLRH